MCIRDRAGVDTAIAVAIPLAVAGLFLTMIVRTLSVICVHQMDAAASKGSFKGVEAWHIIAVCVQGIQMCIRDRARSFQECHQSADSAQETAKL